MTRAVEVGAGAACLCLAAGAFWLVSPAVAQDAPPRLVFDIGSALRYDDNPGLALGGGDPRLRFDTSLGLTLNTTTRDQVFSLGLKGLARVASDEALALRAPSVTLAYSRETANSRLSLNGAFQQAQVDLFQPLFSLEGGVLTTDILATTGTVTSRTATLNFATGLQAPLGFDLAATVNDRLYSDTSDPSVYDSTSQSVKAGVHLRMPDTGREISLSAGLSASDYQNATQTTRDSSELSLDLAQDLRPGLKLQAALGQITVISGRTGGPDSTSAGATGSLGLEATLANGAASVTLASNRDALGSRQSLSFARSLDLPNGTLAATLGLSSRPGQEGQLVGNLSYALKLATGNFGVTLSRQIALNGDTQDVANTGLDLNYQHDINDVSRLGLSLNVLETGSGGSAGVTDVLRQMLSASYARDLTADWQVTAGYQFRSLETSSASGAQSNAVFLTINRTFILRP